MKNGIRRISTLLMALALVLSLSVPAFASSVTFEGKSQGFALDGHNQLTATDLFGNFKDLMPGDSVSETITIQNVARDCDYIKLYIRAVSHSDGGNRPASSDVNHLEENVASMEDFLSQLYMEVYQGSSRIYFGSPDELDGFRDNVYLGSFRKDQGTTLTVNLKVPAYLDNEYAFRAGEVDWVFTVECYDDSGKLIQTGQNNRPIAVLLALGVVVMAAGVVMISRKRKRNG